MEADHEAVIGSSRAGEVESARVACCSSAVHLWKRMK